MAALRSARLQRAIEVLSRLQTERRSHYVRGRAADQFDAVIGIDESAADPPNGWPCWEAGEVPELACSRYG
jgi:erythromycin esterase-like protein